MAGYSFGNFRPGLYLQDTPIAYQTPYGPSIAFEVKYNQRTTKIADQPETGGLGPRWTHSYNQYIELSGNGSPASEIRYVRGDGNYSTYEFWRLGKTTFWVDENGAAHQTVNQTPHYRSRYRGDPILQWLLHNQGGPGFRLAYRNGTKLIFKQPNGPKPTRYYLTAMIDPFGNRVTLSYDAKFRLKQISDALNQATTIDYQGQRIWKVTDPFGRFATFAYDAKERLESITDPVGIVSSFTYGGGDFVHSMTTPYGTTQFRTGALEPWGRVVAEGKFIPTSVPGIYVEAEDPNGDIERIEKSETVNFPEQLQAANVAGTPANQAPTVVYAYSDPNQIGVSAGGYTYPVAGAPVATSQITPTNDPPLQPTGQAYLIIIGTMAYPLNLPAVPYNMTPTQVVYIGNQEYYVLELIAPADNNNMDDEGTLPKHEAPLAPQSVAVAGQNVSFLPKNDNLHFRNIYYWDKEQFHKNGRDHKNATIFNYMAINNKIVSVRSSVKYPLEGRIWFNYPDQKSPHAPGSMNLPSKVVYAVENAAGGHSWAMSQRTFTSNGRPRVLTDPKGRQRRYNYHNNNQDVSSVQVMENGAWKTVVTLGNYVSRQPRTITYPNGTTITREINARGQITKTTRTAGGQSFVTDYVYLPNGYLDKVVVDGLTVADVTHDGAGRVRTVTDEHNYTLTYDYDNLDRTTVVTHPDNTTEQTDYGVGLSVTATKDRENRWTRIKVTALGQPEYVQDSKGQYTAYKWCRCGDIRDLIDAKGRKTHWERDIQGRVLGKGLPGGRKFTYAYQPLSGRLASMTMPADQGGAPTVTYAYDLTGALLTQNYAAVDTPDVSFQYNDSLGRLTRMTDGQGQTNYGYYPINSAGMGALKTINGPWANDTIEMLVDAAGRNSGYQIKNDAGNVLSYSEMTFDAKERVANITDNLGVHVMAYEGDTSRVLGVSTKDANDLTREILNRSLRLPHSAGTATGSPQSPTCAEPAQPTGATQISKFGYTYTPTGQIDTWTQELGLAGNDATTSIWDIDYDPIYQLKDVKITAPDGALRSNYSYGYDEAGNRIRETVDTATTTARHNSRNEIFETGGGTRTIGGRYDQPPRHGDRQRTKCAAQAAVRRYGISLSKRDPCGRRGERNRSHRDRSSRRRRRPRTTPSTWPECNTPSPTTTTGTLPASATSRLARSGSTNGTASTGCWPSRVTSCLNGKARGANSPTMVKAGESSRKEQVWRGAWEVDSENKYLWIGSKIAQKRSADGRVVEASYTGFGEERTDENGAKVDYYYTRDHLGSIREVVDDSGALKARYSYDPWGRRSKIEGEEDFEVEFGYTGHHFHEESKLHLTWYRAYDAGLGRWLSADPFGSMQTKSMHITLELLLYNIMSKEFLIRNCFRTVPIYIPISVAIH